MIWDFIVNIIVSIIDPVFFPSILAILIFHGLIILCKTLTKRTRVIEAENADLKRQVDFLVLPVVQERYEKIRNIMEETVNDYKKENDNLLIQLKSLKEEKKILLEDSKNNAQKISQLSESIHTLRETIRSRNQGIKDAEKQQVIFIEASNNTLSSYKSFSNITGVTAGAADPNQTVIGSKPLIYHPPSQFDHVQIGKRNSSGYSPENKNPSKRKKDSFKD